MKKLNFYYIYDNINECVIGDKPFFAPNDLAAAVCFRDSFIKPEKIPYNYKSLDLIRFASADITPDGNFLIDVKQESIKPIRICGKEILTFIRSECDRLNIEDDFLEEKKENE